MSQGFFCRPVSTFAQLTTQRGGTVEARRDSKPPESLRVRQKKGHVMFGPSSGFQNRPTRPGLFWAFAVR